MTDLRVIFEDPDFPSSYEFSQHAVLNGTNVGGTDPTTTAIRIASGNSANGQTDTDNAYMSATIFE